MDWSTVGTVTGSIMLAGSGLQALEALYLQVRRKRNRLAVSARHRAAFEERLHAVLLRARAAAPTFKAWSGNRTFQVGALVEEATDCKSVYLIPADGRPLPRFEPGQYLTFSLSVDPRQKPVVRCYSLSDSPREDYYRITVKRARPPVGQERIPPGIGSNYIHDGLALGNKLEVQAPQGEFFLDPTENQPVVLIGAGIGITPMLSMVNSITQQKRNITTYLIAGFRNGSEHPFREHLQHLAKTHENLHYRICYSSPMPGERLDRDYQHRGRVDISYLKSALPSNNFRFYVCGPAGMMESIVPALLEWGVPREHIHFEAFGPASVQSLSRSGASETIYSPPCHVTFSHVGTRLHWEGTHESLLSFAESEGVSLDYGCRAGSCGQCLLKVRQGQVKHVKEPGILLENDECLTCISVPQGDVALEC